MNNKMVITTLDWLVGSCTLNLSPKDSDLWPMRNHFKQISQHKRERSFKCFRHTSQPSLWPPLFDLVLSPSLPTAATWMACCGGPTTPSTAWRRACSPATSTRPCTLASGWRPAPSSSTPTTRRTWRRRSEASSSRASAKTWVSWHTQRPRSLDSPRVSFVQSVVRRELALNSAVLN